MNTIHFMVVLKDARHLSIIDQFENRIGGMNPLMICVFLAQKHQIVTSNLYF